MKRIILMLLIMSILLCGCRPIDTGEGEADTEHKLNVEYVTNEVKAPNDDGITVVCVDAGHGFGDVGCSSDYLGCYEYEVTIDVVKRLRTSLESLGATVILTHDGESYPDEKDIIAGCERHGIDYDPEKVKDNEIFSAYERALYEEILTIEEKIDFFISIHVNSVEHAEYVDGYELYYCNENPHSSNIELFGQQLGQVLDNDIVVDGCEYDDSYLVTKYASIPSVLLEIGYATNPEDARKMRDEAWKNDLGKILADEIVKYIEGVQQ